MWKNERKVKGIIVILAVVILFCTAEFANQLRQLPALPTNIDSISLVVIQVQAVLIGLCLSVIALLSGRITESFFGVKINDFIMNLKPKVFKQSSIIGTELWLIIVSFVFYLVHWHYMVFASFLVACVLVWISISNIYEMFSGSEKIEEEIPLYLRERMEDSEDYNKQEIIKNFTSEWSNFIVNQPEGDYKRYLSFYEYLFSKMIETDGNRIILRNCCVELSRFLLQDERSFRRGIEYIKTCNEWAISWLGRTSQEGQEVPFNLFHEIEVEFITALGHMDFSDVEECFHWGSFCEELLGVSLIAFNPEKSEIQLRSVENLAYWAGKIISGHMERNNHLWGNPLTKRFYHFPCSEKINSILCRSYYKQRFLFAISQLRYDSNNIISKYLLSKAVPYTGIIDEEVFLRLEIHCYLYYIVYYESTECAEIGLKKCCKEILDDKLVRASFSDMLITASANDRNIISGENKIDLFNADLIERMETELQRFDLYPDGEGIKTYVMGHAVRDFVLFTFAYISLRYYNRELIQRIIPEEETTGLYLDYCDQNKKTNALKNYVKMLSEGYFTDNEEALYSVLFEQIREKYKCKVLSDPVPIEDSTEIQRLNTRIVEDLRIRCRPFIGDKTGEKLEVPLLRMYCETHSDIARFLDNNPEYIFNSFVAFIHQYLEKNNKTIEMERKDFADDDELLLFLSKYIGQFYLGSKFALKPSHYINNEVFYNTLDQIDNCTVGSGKIALLMEKNVLNVYIEDIFISSRQQTIEDSKAIFDDTTDLYTYSVYGLPVNFTEEELQYYLKTHKKFVEIKVGVYISYQGERPVTAVRR